MNRTTDTLLGFLCIGLSLSTLLGCPKNVPVKPLPPVVDGSMCATAVVVKSEDVCKHPKTGAIYFTPNGHVCMKCSGGASCTAKGIEVFCVSKEAGCADSLCAPVSDPPSHR